MSPASRAARRAGALLLPLAAVLAAASCHTESKHGAPATRPAPVDPPTMQDAAPRDYAGLHNVVAYHDGYYSGSVPEGDAGFDTLAAMGVATIISVDGAEPDVALAKARDIRYIHLPIGYDGFDDERRLQLVRASRDAMETGPVYIHCHHGKHRSAGAAAAVVASLGWSTPDEAIARMKVSGTALTYRGLYACAANATVFAASAIDAVPADFPEVSHPADFVRAMIELDEIAELLKRIEEAGWAPPADHPDLVPVAEAGRMADVLRILAEGGRATEENADFAAGLRHNGDLAQALEDALLAPRPEPPALSAQLKLIAASCKDCHARHRD